MSTISDSFGQRAQVLVVDDSPITTESMRQALQVDFDVDTVDSGESCLERISAGSSEPDLILLDIEMGGIDGFETCLRLRDNHTMPVIFVSSHDDLAERIKAFDSGGDDFVIKPFDPEVILRKAKRAVEHQRQKKQLAAEKESLQSTVVGYMRDIGNTGVLLGFLRSSLGLADYEMLAQRLLEATAEYGVRCHVQVRHANGCFTLTPAGKASPLEESVLEKSVSMGRIFQFSRRLVVNYSSVSIMILDLPVDQSAQIRLRENISVLAEVAEAISENISMRKEAALCSDALQSAVGGTAVAVETLRELYRNQQTDTQLRLHEMIDNVEKSYVNLGLTELQEARVSNILREGAEHTMRLFEVGLELEKGFAQILEALSPTQGKSGLIELW